MLIKLKCNWRSWNRPFKFSQFQHL